MKANRIASFLLAATAAAMISGCAAVGPLTQTLVSGSGSGSVTTSQAAESSSSGSLQVSQPAGITIAGGADVETEINEAVYLKANPSVVYIENIASLGQSRFGANAGVTESTGSGWVWDTRGYIVTNNHVVEGADQINVTFADGVEAPAEVVGADPGSDLAVVKVDPKVVDLVPAEQGDIADVKVGGRAIAIGNPFGLVGTMTTGIVSAIGRSLAVDPDNQSSFNIPQVIQTDAAINPGNSGGPLLNESGQVIGVNFQIRSESGSNTGVGFAIPINIVQRVVPALIDDGLYQHAYLGIRGQTYSPAWADALNLPDNARGAYIIDVAQNGPAGRAGLRGATAGDTDVALGVDQTGIAYLPAGGDVIIAVDGEAIQQFDDLLVYLESHKSPGDKVTLTVLRSGGAEIKVTVTLGARPTE